MRADEVYAILKGKLVKLTEDIKSMGDWKPIQHKGTVQTADDLPADAKEGWMYNIATDSIYGAAGMNVVKTADGWDPMGPIVNMSLYLDKETAKKEYQPVGDYSTKEEVKKEYQPKGDYVTKTIADETYQPKGDYLTEKKASETYQPTGDYLTEQKAKETYQPAGNYLESVPQATAELLGGIKASAKTANETVEAKIDPDTGKMYVPELPGSEDLSKEETAQKILAKLQELLPLIEQVASNGIASSVNGFSFLYGTDGSVTMTYTPDASSEAETALLPTGTTQAKIAQATKEIAASLKIIAGKDEVTA